VNSGVIGIFVFSLCSRFGKKDRHTAPFAALFRCSCHCSSPFLLISLATDVIGILSNTMFIFSSFSGIKPYWFLFSNLLVCRWWLILFISSFSSSFPPVFIKLMGRYFCTSLSPSLPGFTIGCIIDIFQICRNCPLCRHSLYTSVKKVGKLLET